MKMKGIKGAVASWLEATSRGLHPSGGEIEVYRINDGSIVAVIYDGWQSFGSGGFSAGAEFFGKEPVFVKEQAGNSNGFTDEAIALFELRAPSVIYEWSSDYVGATRRLFRKRAWVCASDAQINKARENRLLTFEQISDDE